ncbi:Hypothetical Protein FCC1311_091242 [Hondaea fermentalgiana]|uniref:Uncharacterized protein n=1 Tax=Hondaea fermentalgiana TaxID=2315210 RepID=A0A2R5GT11_9STRA|nr:Hypothetical Protein FCC1311_091242 [Hondaea fermentalgiana]|eukprot:GBG32898.1 Hypothetical Protein FCC1311_091242 [Hondaea fermentalgiana]
MLSRGMGGCDCGAVREVEVCHMSRNPMIMRGIDRVVNRRCRGSGCLVLCFGLGSCRLILICGMAVHVTTVTSPPSPGVISQMLSMYLDRVVRIVVVIFTIIFIFIILDTVLVAVLVMLLV